MKKIIVDTDIGGDIDDIWALMLILSSDFFDVRLISVTEDDVDYKTRLVAKILTAVNRTDIPIARGISTSSGSSINPQAAYLEGFSLETYPGQIFSTYEEGYRAILKDHPGITVLGLAPFTSLAQVIELLEEYHIELIAMAGSIYKGYFESLEPSPECNIVTNIPAAQKVLGSRLAITLLPLDVCGNLVMEGEDYQMVIKSHHAFANAIIENYRIWDRDYVGGAKKGNPLESSSILYDLAPVWYLLFAQNFTLLELSIHVDEQGYTKIGSGRTLTVATSVRMVPQMMRFTAEQYCTEGIIKDEIKRIGIEGKYSLIYTMSRTNPELAVYECGWEVCRPKHFYGPTKREYYILHVVAEGAGKFVVNGQTYHLKANDCFLIVPNVTTYYEADRDNPWSYYWVGFNGLEASTICKKAGFIDHDVYAQSFLNADVLKQRIKSISEIEARKGSVEYSMLGNLYLLFSEMVSDRDVSSESRNKDCISQAIKLINENYWQDITIAYVARYVGLDRTYFYRLFKNAMSLSPQEYLIATRLSKAMILLKDTSLKLGEISLKIGYENYISFVKVFKKKYGITPKEYRAHPWETTKTSNI